MTDSIVNGILAFQNPAGTAVAKAVRQPPKFLLRILFVGFLGRILLLGKYSDVVQEYPV